MVKRKRGAGKRKPNFFVDNYKLSWKYIKESKNFIYFTFLTFFAISIIGFLYPVFFREQIISLINNLIKQTENLSSFELIKFIFFNNLQSSFLGMTLGLFFGIFPLLVLVVNGYILGFVASASVSANGFSSLWRLFPHGIFELPAVFISLGLGLKLGTFLFYKQKIKHFKDYFWSSLRVFLFIILPLLIVAAIIEGILISFFG
jgi:stage II sporulation protein M